MTAQDPIYDSKNPRHNRVMTTLGVYLQETQNHDLYGGLMRIAAHTLILQRQCAADWAELSKIKPSDMPRWWRAGAFEPEAAQSLIELGVGAGLAKLPCKEGCEKFETFAYQVSMGMLSAEQAKREIRAD